MDDQRFRELVATRVQRPAAIAETATRRRRPTSRLGPHGRLMTIAANHPARGALAAGSRPFAMGDRVDLLDRLLLALSRPGPGGAGRRRRGGCRHRGGAAVSECSERTIDTAITSAPTECSEGARR